MSKTVEVNYVLNIDTSHSEAKVRLVETTVFRTIGLMRKAGVLPEQVSKTLADIERAVMAARMLYVAMKAMELELGPIGWIYAGVTGITAVMMGGEALLEMTQ